MKNWEKTLIQNNNYTFQLYNIEYTIKYIDNKYTIFQSSMNSQFSADTLLKLLESYKVYGESLYELLEKII